ncbi:MAG: hypothetical protein IT249_15055 [Chitinophagaceae bacterium]|nr:hypothetical protein [Chitinophagaceae bacterium]
MIKPTAFRLPQYLVDKVSFLMNILKCEKQKYEIASISIQDKQLRDSISWLAQESNQYICELTSQLKSIGAIVAIDSEEDNQSAVPAPPVFTEAQLSSNVIQFCKDSEKMLISAYRVVLNEPYLVEGLRTLIRQQLNGIMYAFLQLKLLYNLKK